MITNLSPTSDCILYINSQFKRNMDATAITRTMHMNRRIQTLWHCRQFGRAKEKMILSPPAFNWTTTNYRTVLWFEKAETMWKWTRKHSVICVLWFNIWSYCSCYCNAGTCDGLLMLATALGTYLVSSNTLCELWISQHISFSNISNSFLFALTQQLVHSLGSIHASIHTICIEFTTRAHSEAHRERNSIAKFFGDLVRLKQE